jgi:hypothetical protein
MPPGRVVYWWGYRRVIGAWPEGAIAALVPGQSGNVNDPAGREMREESARYAYV